jgi:hypothetical protein
MTDNGDFEILPTGEMRRKYGLYASAAPRISLDRSLVPKLLWPLIPYAEIWGISDDLIREDFARMAGHEAVEELRLIVAPYEDALDEWLAGPDAMSESPSIEYIAFSCMRMAADGA